MLRALTRRRLVGSLAVLAIASTAVGCAGNAAQVQLARESPVREPVEIIERHNAQGELHRAEGGASDMPAPAR